MQRATKIVATLGPASSTQDVLNRMLAAGVDVVRLNFSHGAAADHEQRARLVLDDGLIRLGVESVLGNEITTRVEVGGVLSNNKGINRLGGGLTAPALTAKDMDDMKTGVAIEADYIAISFPKNKEDMYMARQLLRAAGGKALLIAKIERAEAISALEEIIDASDGIMVARGDLAIEVGNA